MFQNIDSQNMMLLNMFFPRVLKIWTNTFNIRDTDSGGGRYWITIKKSETWKQASSRSWELHTSSVFWIMRAAHQHRPPDHESSTPASSQLYTNILPIMKAATFWNLLDYFGLDSTFYPLSCGGRIRDKKPQESQFCDTNLQHFRMKWMAAGSEVFGKFYQSSELHDKKYVVLGGLFVSVLWPFLCIVYCQWLKIRFAQSTLDMPAI
jgi:hypothetical protein